MRKPVRRANTHTFLAVAAALVVAAVPGAVLYFTVLTVPVVAGGRSMSVLSGTTAGDLVGKGLVKGRRGNVLSARTRSVVATGGGGAAVVLVNGRPTPPTRELKRGDVVTMRKGSDVVEPLRTRVETIVPTVRYEGTGPVQAVISTGRPGSRRIQCGSLSGQVVKRVTTVEMVPSIVLRTRPSTGKKVIALTFDDGPWPGQTAAILKILKANGAHATFFQIGRQARLHPAWSRMLAKAGMLMGNHTESHPYPLDRLPAPQVARQITEAQADITAACGQKPRYFRPPGGVTAPAMYPVLAKLGMKWVQWDIDTKDWRRPSTASIVNKVLKNARDGAVVLMHDGGGDRSHTIEALPIILRALKAEGYTFVNIDQLRRLPHRMG